MRTSTNQINAAGILQNGYDYTNQAWVINGRYEDCGHAPAGTVMGAFPGLREEGHISKGCYCYGRTHAGELCTVRGNGQ